MAIYVLQAESELRGDIWFGRFRCCCKGADGVACCFTLGSGLHRASERSFPDREEGFALGDAGSAGNSAGRAGVDVVMEFSLDKTMGFNLISGLWLSIVFLLRTN